MNGHFPRYWFYFLLSIAALFLLPVAATAQTSSINGVVTDPSGAVVPGVTMTLINAATARTTTATTNSSGFFVFPDLPAGVYTLRAEKKGFKASEHVGIHVDPASSVSVNSTLQLGQVSQTVHVTAATVNLQTSSGQVSRLINTTQFDQLPVNGRNFVSLAGLQPGVVQSFSFNSFQYASVFASQCTQVNGLTGESNNWTIDGVPSTRTRANGAIVGMPSEDDISEETIVTNGYMPEYGRGAGGQFIVSTKSGGDQWHGDLFDFERNNAFDSRYFNATSVPKLDYDDFGGTIGGPVPFTHHKLFFFWSEEDFQEVSGNPQSGTVPTVQDRSGDLNAYCAVFTSNCPKVPAYLNGMDGLVAGSPFPGNIIPTNLLSANGTAMAKGLFLLPNTVTHAGTAYPLEGGTNSVFTYNGTDNTRLDGGKFTFNPNAKNSMFVALHQYTSVQEQPFYGASGCCSGALGLGFQFPYRSGSFDWTSTFSPTLLNDFSAGGQRDHNHPFPTPGLPGDNGLDRTSLGINFPYIFPDVSKDIAGKIPTLLVSGFNNVSGLPYPSFSTGHVWDVTDTVTKIAGNNTLKFGFWWEHDGENDDDQVRVSPGGGVGNNLNGQFEFNAATTNPNTTGSPLADLLLGNFDNYSELGYRNLTQWGGHDVAFFGQDSAKIKPNVTLEGGLRWSYFSPFSANWCNWAMFDPLFYSHAPGVEQVISPSGTVVGGNPYNGIAVPCKTLPQGEIGHAVLGQVVTAQNINSIDQTLRNDGMMRGLSPWIVDEHFGDFMPRLGFAWSPKYVRNTVVRGAGGLFYNRNTLSDNTLPGGVTPFQLAAEVFNGHADNPAGVLTPGATLPIPMTGTDLNYDIPLVYEWDLSVQHMFSNSTLLDVAYVGNRSIHDPLNADLNQPLIGTFTNPANAGIPQDALRPSPGIGGDLSEMMEGESEYNALQVEMQHRFVHGLQFNVNYTYSKAFDNQSSIYSVATDTYDPMYNWGLAPYSQTHNFLVTWIYDEPFFKNNTSLVGRIAGGWEVSGDLALFSGFPTSITASGDPLGNGVNSIGGSELAGIRPNCATRGSRSLFQFFNTACFYEPGAAGAPTGATLYGTAATGIIEQPGLDNLDFAFMKNGPIAEKWGHDITYQFRAEFFNGLNHPSANGIDTTVTDSSFGQVNSWTTQREIQFALKILF
jgi:hypothetical protein